MTTETQFQKKCTLLTCHVWNSARKAGFHHLANAYKNLGWDVMFVTTDLDYIDWVRGDFRFASPCDASSHRTEIKPKAAIALRPYRLYSLRSQLLNQFIRPLYSKWGDRPLPRQAVRHIQQSDLVIFESSTALMYFDQVAKLNPTARKVYRVSDDLTCSPVHPLLIETEQRIAEDFSLISTPCHSIFSRFRQFSNARLQFHAITKCQFEAETASPYQTGSGPNAVFVGNCNVDYKFIEIASHILPEVNFHIIGRHSSKCASSNVHWYGELPYELTIPYIQHADVGLNPLAASGFTHSLKMLQYTYCNLPIVASSLNRCDLSHVYYYHPGDIDSIATAVRNAVEHKPSVIDRDWIQSWEELAMEIANASAQN